MYTLTLTNGERKAIDWIGHRYWNGRDLFIMLMGCDASPDADWDSPDDITFQVNESTAWTIQENIEEHGVPCFSHDLADKLYAFQLAIV